MFEREEVTNAVRIQQLGYKFLRYITNKIDNKDFTFSRIHNDESSADVVASWVKDYYDYLPTSILPKKEEIQIFSNYFASYLTTSFELNENPVQTSSRMECYCDICLQFVNLSHLKSISPNKMDREFAQEKRYEVIVEFAKHLAVDISEDLGIQIANDKLSKRDAAYLAYTKSLFDRINFSKGGVYSLALWREIAWSEGSPIPDFVLNSADIFNALRRIELRILSEKAD